MDQGAPHEVRGESLWQRPVSLTSCGAPHRETHRKQAHLRRAVVCGSQSGNRSQGSRSMARPFLTAAWRDLVMLNYEIDPTLLTPHVPRGCELDDYRGKHLVSVVGFQFLRTK